MDLAFDAMMFAREVHKNQVRKYTGNPYTDHLAEVAGVAVTAVRNTPYDMELAVAVAWLHDCVEDQGVQAETLTNLFGGLVSDFVILLSDLESGTRAERKAASRARLAEAPPLVQTIKVADLISNTSGIVKHDPKFALVYLEEKRLLLDGLTSADERLVKFAREQIGAST